MLKVVEWITLHWKQLSLVLGFLFLFTMIRPLKAWIEQVKDGIRDIFTPIGFLVFVTLILFGIYLFSVFKGYL